jgi:outer membrane protein OmpA-like peptidoglycan-associated protein
MRSSRKVLDMLLDCPEVTKAMKFSVFILLLAGMLAAQAPNPVQTNITPNPNGPEPIFRVDVTSRTVTAVNYHNRQGKTTIDFRGTALMPQARGSTDVTANTGATRISLHFDRLSNPAQFGPEYLTFVAWAITPEGRAERLGEVTLKNPQDKNAGLYATTDLQTFGMIVTAEPYFSVSQPSDVVVMENFVRNNTAGTWEVIDAKYELLRRGQYTLNVRADALAPITADLRVPLELREAREAIAIAKAQGADQYAADTMQKVAVDMLNAEGFYHSHNEKELDTVTREATQMAEDARRISLVKEREIAEQAERDASARREAQANAEADEQARLRAKADAEKADAEHSKQDAIIAMNQARNAQQQAEAAQQQAEAARQQAEAAQQQAETARQAALAEQQRLAEEKAGADAARVRAEQDTQALRARLLDQLNAILQTRDTARGLIVNMSDVLFDFDQATLKPGAKEKLAKVSGILLAYPTLRMEVEGHTDSVGTDDYNLQLSQRRADAVRDYLVSNGIAMANVQSVGLGKAAPVASNDTAEGRQQNRRVEMVVSGDIIGQPVSTASDIR